MRLVALVGVLLFGVADAHAQLLRLTPEAAGDILAMAQKAHAESNGDRYRAVDSFGKAFGAKYPSPNPLTWNNPRYAEYFEVSIYAPTGWYAFQLWKALQNDEDLTAVKADDVIALVLSPRSPQCPVFQKVAIQQGGTAVPQTSSGIQPFLDVFGRPIPPSSMISDFSGRLVSLAGWATFGAAAIDTSQEAVVVLTPQGGQNISWSLSADAMKMLR